MYMKGTKYKVLKMTPFILIPPPVDTFQVNESSFMLFLELDAASMRGLT